MLGWHITRTANVFVSMEKNGYDCEVPFSFAQQYFADFIQFIPQQRKFRIYVVQEMRDECLYYSCSAFQILQHCSDNKLLYHCFQCIENSVYCYLW